MNRHKILTDSNNHTGLLPKFLLQTSWIKVNEKFTPIKSRLIFLGSLFNGPKYLSHCQQPTLSPTWQQGSQSAKSPLQDHTIKLLQEQPGRFWPQKLWEKTLQWLVSTRGKKSKRKLVVDITEEKRSLSKLPVGEMLLDRCSLCKLAVGEMLPDKCLLSKLPVGDLLPDKCSLSKLPPGVMLPDKCSLSKLPVGDLQLTTAHWGNYWLENCNCSLGQLPVGELQLLTETMTNGELQLLTETTTSWTDASLISLRSFVFMFCSSEFQSSKLGMPVIWCYFTRVQSNYHMCLNYVVSGHLAAWQQGHLAGWQGHLGWQQGHLTS